ncbi:MAG: hypothetical protein WAU68_14845 [Vitreimonas sp.]
MQSAEIERLATRVRASARDGGLIETAQVKLIGLDEVREAAGSRWPRMREYVRERSIKIIAGRIGPEDAVVACGDGFLVVFADAAAEHTKRRCAEIHDALIAFYLGEDALSPLRAEIRQERASAAELAGLVSTTIPGKRPLPDRNDLMLGRFWPLWSPHRHAVAAYQCAPLIELADAPARMGYAAEFLDKAAHRDTDYLDLDLCLLEQACAASERPQTAPIGVSVHSTTMQSRRSRKQYLEHVGANASPAQGRMFITIAEVAPGTPLISLSEWSHALKNTFGRVALDLHHSDRALSAIASAGVWAAGYHLPFAQNGPSGSLRGALNQIHSSCQVLRRQGLLPMVHGFTTQSFFDLASFSDLWFASGEALWPSLRDVGATATPVRRPALEAVA